MMKFNLLQFVKCFLLDKSKNMMDLNIQLNIYFFKHQSINE